MSILEAVVICHVDLANHCFWFSISLKQCDSNFSWLYIKFRITFLIPNSRIHIFFYGEIKIFAWKVLQNQKTFINFAKSNINRINLSKNKQLLFNISESWHLCHSSETLKIKLSTTKSMTTIWKELWGMTRRATHASRKRVGWQKEKHSKGDFFVKTTLTEKDNYCITTIDTYVFMVFNLVSWVVLLLSWIRENHLVRHYEKEKDGGRNFCPILGFFL